MQPHRPHALSRLVVLLLVVVSLPASRSFAGPGELAFESTELDVHFVGEIAGGDFNRDGFPDVAATGGAPDAIFLLLGDRNGALTETARIPLPGFGLGLVAEDFDGDGLLDLATTYQGNGFLLLRGDGAGGFSETYRAPVYGWPTDLVTGDFDGDGNVDAAALTRDTFDSFVHVFLGDGRGGLSPPRTHPVPGMIASDAEVADVTQDRVPDILLAAGETGILALDGRNGSFTPPRLFFPPTGAADYTAITLHESTLYIGGFARGETTVLTVDLRGRITGRGPTPSPETLPNRLAVADLDNNGALEVVATYRTREFGEVATFSGGALCPAAVRLERTSGRPLLLDLDRNGQPDVVSHEFRTLSVHLNRSFDPLAPRRGTVNRGVGQVTDVVFLNGTAGAGPKRRVEYGVLAPFHIRVENPPSIPLPERAPFAMYLWLGLPRLDRITDLPFGIGRIALPIPLAGRNPQPDILWNNAGRRNRLGVPIRASTPAPTDLVRRNRLVRVATFYIQGLIFDPGSAAEVEASVTNGIEAVPVP